MIEQIEGMPAGTIGFRASGEVTADDYRQVLEPPLRAAVASGGVRMLYAVDSGFRMDAGAMARDAVIGLELGVGHHAAWERTAVVTDVEWVRQAIHLFAWMAPGEVRIFTAADVEEAKGWVAGSPS